jgi:oxygen-independent coproporphyrinogen-3 oxidase
MCAEFGDEAVATFDGVVAELVEDGLLAREEDRVMLTMRGRMLSNEVFAKFLGVIGPGGLELPMLTR